MPAARPASSSYRWSRRLDPSQHSAGLNFQDRERLLQFVNGLPDFGMFRNLALQSFEQRVSFGYMFRSLPWTGFWL